MNFILQTCRLSWFALVAVFLVTGCTDKKPELWELSQETGVVELDTDSSGGVDIIRGGTNATNVIDARTNLEVYSTVEIDAALALETDDQVASEVEFTPYSTIIATDVQGAIQEALDDGGTDDQIAAEVVFTPAGGVIATDVQAAIVEVAGNAAAATDDQTATEVPFAANGSIIAENVQDAINEVRDEATAGSGDVIGPVDSLDGEVALFDLATGKLIKRGQMVEDSSGNLGVVGSVTSPEFIGERVSGLSSVITLYEDPDVGNNYIAITVPTSMPSDVTLDAASLVNNSIVWVLPDVAALSTGGRIRIPAKSTWINAYSWCNAGESNLIYSLYQAPAIGGTFSLLGTISHNSGTISDTVDISAFVDPDAGYWVRLDITNQASTASDCTLAIALEAH